jgi:hypothetical protein
MPRTRFAGFVFLAALLAGGRCKEGQVKTEELVARIQSEIAVGMTRAEVEQTLARLPVDYVDYVSREDLERTNEATFQGTPLSGRLEVSTPWEDRFMRLQWATVFIDLDEHERVVNVRVRKNWTGL